MRLPAICLVVLGALLVAEPGRAGALKPAAETPQSLLQTSFRDLEGDSHRISDWRGKLIVLNFWASWCAPCLQEIPDLVALQEEFRDRDLQVIGLGLDEERKLRNVRRTLEIDYPVLVGGAGRESQILRAWGNEPGVLPYSVVIDREGRIVHRHPGTFTREDFERYVLPLITQAPQTTTASNRQQEGNWNAPTIDR